MTAVLRLSAENRNHQSSRVCGALPRRRYERSGLLQRALKNLNFIRHLRFAGFMKPITRVNRKS
jgi:hypothetical protein